MDELIARDLAAVELASMQASVDKVDQDKRLHGLPPSDVEFVLTNIQRIGNTWCVFYNNRAYVNTGNFVHALAGNGPILISANGRIGHAGSALCVEHYVEEFERSATS
jgi:hypothetical protein